MPYFKTRELVLILFVCYFREVVSVTCSRSAFRARAAAGSRVAPPLRLARVPRGS